MQELGVPHTELQEVLPDRFNAVGRYETGRPGRTVVLTGHIDTKPVSVGWEREPFGGQREGERLYGHGIRGMTTRSCEEGCASFHLALSFWRGAVPR